MLYLIIVLAIAALVLLISFITYRIALYSPVGNQNDDFAIMETPQMEVYKEQSLEMIRIFRERPFERVYIQSFDGLRLAGRYFSSALEFARLPLDELRLWIDSAVKESRKG